MMHRHSQYGKRNKSFAVTYNGKRDLRHAVQYNPIAAVTKIYPSSFYIKFSKLI